MATIDTIVIGCMDRRLNGYIDSNYANDHTLLLRNAGANVQTLEESIRDILKTEKISKIVLLPHTSNSPEGIRDGDCGAMKFTFAAAKTSEALISPSTRAGLVAQFHGAHFGSVHELEKVNATVQEQALHRIIADLGITPPKIETVLVDTSPIGTLDNKGHALVIARPGTLRYTDVFAKIREQGHDIGIDSTYVIQARSLSPVMPDIEIAATALKLNGTEHPIIAFMRNGDKEGMLREVQDLKQQSFFPKVPIIGEVEANGKRRRVGSH